MRQAWPVVRDAIVLIALLLFIGYVIVGICEIAYAGTNAPVADDPVKALPSVPGLANPQVTQASIGSTICRSGWTKTVRPPVSYTNALKLKLLAAMGYTGDPHAYELDHAWPIELGGDPRSPLNLWVEPWNGKYGAHRKDVVETNLKRRVCKGTITLAEAGKAITGNWIAAYQQYVGPLP